MLERGRLERLTNRRVLITIIIIMAGFKGAQASHQAADFFLFRAGTCTIFNLLY